MHSNPLSPGMCVHALALPDAALKGKNFVGRECQFMVINGALDRLEL